MDNMLQQRKKTTGRKKIEIKKLEKDSNKQVTFSKRRQGLFRKASELCILCDVRAAIIVFSPADKLYSFGQPNTDVILNSYINGTTEFVDAKSTEDCSTYTEYNGQCEKALKILEMEKKKLADIENLAKSWNRGDWWNDSIDHMSIDQLEQFMISLYELRNKFLERADELLMNSLMFQ
ncbi:agamous MADS-box protein AGL62 [Trifolium repens]|nr:agamous MADS-box protein AGL62 [Trifolium repens]